MLLIFDDIMGSESLMSIDLEDLPWTAALLDVVEKVITWVGKKCVTKAPKTNGGYMSDRSVYMPRSSANKLVPR